MSDFLVFSFNMLLFGYVIHTDDSWFLIKKAVFEHMNTLAYQQNGRTSAIEEQFIVMGDTEWDLWPVNRQSWRSENSIRDRVT